MAQRRMFSKKIVETDRFLEMPVNAKLLYFYLNMSADDDGFVGNPKMIKMMSGATDDDMKILIAKQYIIPFESGVVVIKDWKIHNYIASDRYNKTQFKDERSQLSLENGEYKRLGENVIQDVRHSVDTGKVRLGKDRIGKVNKDIVEKSFVFPNWLSETETKRVEKGNPDNYEVRVPIAYLNQVAGKQYRFIEKSIKLVHARLAEGFALNDFKIVIDTKVAEWINDANMNKYLRPETLFGNKFESYLNQTKSNIPDTYGDEYSSAKLGF